MSSDTTPTSTTSATPHDKYDDSASEVHLHFESYKSPYSRLRELQIVSVETLAQDLDKVPLAFLSPTLSTIVYHGTHHDNVAAIVQNGFNIKKLGQCTGNRGFIGAGIYSSTNPSVASEYATRNPNDSSGGDHFQLIACKAVLGNPFHLEWTEDVMTALGMKLKPGYDSHIWSPLSGEEVCIFDARRIRPWWILTVKVVPMTDEAWTVGKQKEEDRLLRFRTGPHANKPLQQVLATHPTYLLGFAHDTSYIHQYNIKRMLVKECLL
jgi:hypothetical protein